MFLQVCLQTPTLLHINKSQQPRSQTIHLAGSDIIYINIYRNWFALDKSKRANCLNPWYHKPKKHYHLHMFGYRDTRTREHIVTYTRVYRDTRTRVYPGTRTRRYRDTRTHAHTQVHHDTPTHASLSWHTHTREYIVSCDTRTHASICSSDSPKRSSCHKLVIVFALWYSNMTCFFFKLLFAFYRQSVMDCCGPCLSMWDTLTGSVGPPDLLL